MMLDIISNNLLSPAVLFFILGIVAALVKSDLKYPQALSESLSIYLLAAIGLKGGMELSQHNWQTLVSPVTGSLILGCTIPVIMFAVCRSMKLDRKNSAALAATYGSVSIVTYGAATAFLDQSAVSYESYMGAMVVLLESPAILISLILLGWLEAKDRKETKLSQDSKPSRYVIGIVPNRPMKLGVHSEIIRESLFGKSILLMLGAMMVGLVTGKEAMPVLQPLFIDLYPSVLVLFLLGMGLSAGERLSEFKQYGLRLLAIAILMPLLFGSLGILVGTLCGLSAGGTALMGVLGASSSYIAAPAAIRQSIPDANPSIYLGMSLGITFPFNLIVGIPIYVELASWF